MKIKDIIIEGQHEKEVSILSSVEQDNRISKMWSGDGDRLLYLWTKQGHLTFKEFKELLKEYTKE